MSSALPPGGGEFSGEAVEELAEWWGLPALPAETVAMVHTATGGNPLYVTQSLAVLAVGPAAATDPDSALG